jgi:peptidoglycan/xylan/chitin deacetylase (PgdA/CDA1 family)
MKAELMGAERKKREGNPPAIRVLMYHSIVNDDPSACGSLYQLPVGQFRAHLEWLDRRGFTAITFEDYRLFREGILNLPKKPVILTFDDGYQDVYQNAFPLLQEYGMRAVIFVLGDRRAASNAWDVNGTEPAAPLLTDSEIIEMHQARFEIGAHSHSHVRLTELPKEAAWKEISYSRMEIEGLLNKPVRSFAYPYGCVNEETKRMVRDAGYTTACSVFTGPSVFGGDEFEIRRSTIFNTTGTLGLGLRLLTPYPQYQWIRWKGAALIRSNGRREKLGLSIAQTLPEAR